MNSNDLNKDQHVLDVMQRCYAITTATNKKPVLRTGNIGTCIVLYGVNKAQGVAFLAHVDAHTQGLNDLIAELKAATNNDLSGFEVAVGMNYAKWQRAAAFISSCAFVGLLVRPYPIAVSILPALLPLLISAHMCFGSALNVFRFAHRYFRNGSIQWKMTNKFFPTAAVEVNSTSTTGLLGLRADDFKGNDRKRRYGPPKGHSVLQPMKSQSGQA